MADRVELFYGPTGEGKSSAAMRMVAEIYNQTGKKGRVWIADGSKSTYTDAGLVDAGVCEVADFSQRDWPLSTVSQIVQGYWPADPDDPDSPLNPPNEADFTSLGITVIEGISMIGQYIMGDNKGGLAQRSGAGEKIGQDSPVAVTDADRDPKTGLYKPGTGTGMTFGGNPLAHFNFAQRRIFSYIEMAKQLPGWVIFTAHERGQEDKMSGEKIIGPEAAGAAMTASLPRQFNNTLHFVTAMAKTKKKDDHTAKMVDEIDTEYRIYTRDHFDPDGNTFVKYKAVTRCPVPEMMPQYIAKEGLGNNILEFYRILAEAKKMAVGKYVKGKVA